jgi:hypothetical protein
LNDGIYEWLEVIIACQKGDLMHIFAKAVCEHIDRELDINLLLFEASTFAPPCVSFIDMDAVCSGSRVKNSLIWSDSRFVICLAFIIIAYWNGIIIEHLGKIFSEFFEIDFKLRAVKVLFGNVT